MTAIALFFGSISVVAADYWLKNNIQTVVKEAAPTTALAMPISKAPSKTIVVAGQALNYGDPVTSENLREVAWAADELPVGAFKTVDEMLKAGERSALSAIELGEPVLTSRITGAGAKPSLSKLVAPGMRAMAIRLDIVSGVSGFVVPGDRVDVMLIRTFRSNDKNPNSLDLAARAAATPNARSVPTEDQDMVVSSQVLANVKVLSIDQIASDRQAEPVIASSATLEVTPLQASLVSAAQQAGELTLHLRPAGNPEEPFTAELPANGLDLNPTAAFEAPAETPRNTTTSITVRLGEELQTHEVTIEGTTR